MRPLWKGAVTFGLVSIPVNLYSGVERQAELGFRLLHRKDHAPIDYRRFCTAENVEVAWKDIVRGYEVARGQFVVLTDEELRKARTPATRMIEIRDFVPACDIDFAYFESPYWLEPEPVGRKAYVLLRQALEESGRVGIGSLVLRQRERLTALRAAGPALRLTTMRFADELRSAEALDIPADALVNPRELELARALVDALASEWKPGQYKDTYREAVRELIQRKLEGRKITAPRIAGPPKVVDLMEALQRSLKQPRREAAGTARRVPAGRRAARRRAA